MKPKRDSLRYILAYYAAGFLALVLAVVFAPGIVVVASDTSGANYAGAVRVSNNSTAAERVVAVFALSTDDLINNGHVNSSLTDTALLTNAGADTAYMPGYGGNPWCVYVPEIGQQTSLTYNLYTGGGVDIGGSRALFGSTNTTDNSSLEISGNGTANWYGRTGGAATLLGKSGSVYMTDSGSGTLTATVITNATTNITQPTQDGTGKLDSVFATRIGEQFTTFSPGLIAAATFKAVKIGSPTGPFYVKVYDSGGTLLGTIGSMDASSVSTNATDYTFNTSNVTVASAASNLKIVAEYSTGNATDYIAIYSKGSDVYSGGVACYYLSSWNTVGTADEYFNILYYPGTVLTATSISNDNHLLSVSFFKNPISNSGQETAASPGAIPTGWTITGGTSTANQTNTQAYLGTYSASITAIGSTAIYYQAISGAAAGETWTISGRLRCGTAGKAYLGLYDNISGYTYSSTHTGDSQWQYFTVTKTFSAGATTFLATAQVLGGYAMYVDCITAIRGTAFPNYAYNVNWSVDGTIKNYAVVDGGVEVLDTAGNWIVNSPSYFYYWSLVKGGINKCKFQWQYASTFTDQWGNGFVATPTFRTTGTDANVTANLTSFSPVSQARAAVSSSESNPMIEDAPEEPTGLYAPTGEIGIFFAPVINNLLDAQGIQREVFWYPAAFVFCYLCGMAASKTNDILVKGIVIFASILACALMNIFGLFPLLFYGLEAFGIIVMGKHYSW